MSNAQQYTLYFEAFKAFTRGVVWALILKQQSDDEADEAELIESDDSEIDRCEQPQHNSETEQEGSDTVVFNEPVMLPECPSINVETTVGSQGHLLFIGKDKLTKWRKRQYPLNIPTRRQNIISHLPGPKGNAKNSKTPRFLREFWETNGTGVEIFPAVMGYRRMKILLQCLRFDRISTRQNRKAIDKFAPIRGVWKLSVSNCKISYCVGERCPFRVYIPNKPTKYGIRIFALVDARTFYSVNLDVYLGEQPIGPFRVNNKVPNVVKRMTEPINGSSRNVTMDNWFTPFSVIEDLFTNHRLTVVGTVKKNKRELPTELTDRKSRPVYSSIFAYQQNMTLVSYVPIQQSRNKQTKSRRVFLTNPALELGNSQLQKRAVNHHVSRDARKTACRLTQIPLQGSRTAPSANHKRGKCFYCRNRDTRYFCQRCQKWLCLEHAQPLCADCVCQGTED
nr:unnamed protein product [Callosobruchus analis]